MTLTAKPILLFGLLLLCGPMAFHDLEHGGFRWPGGLLCGQGRVDHRLLGAVVVEQLSDGKSGWVGFWGGNRSGGEFTNRKITPEAQSALSLTTNAMNTPSSAEPEIIEREKFLVLGTQARFKPDTESGEEFAAIWRRFEAHRELIKTHSTDQKYYGVSFSARSEGGFDYLAGMAVSAVQAIPAGFVMREVPAATYAVFACPVRGIRQTKRYIFTEWRSQPGHEIDDAGPVFEQYPPAEDSESPVLIHVPMKTATGGRRPMFLPEPLRDGWSQWIVGEWKGTGESNTGQGTGVERIEFALNGQFLLCRGEAAITEIAPEHAEYVRRNMHASDEEIERFKREGYQSLQLFTVDQITGEVVGYLFDSLRCIATGRGKREGNREVMEWQWTNGHKSTRITERLSEDRMRVIQRTPMPDGSVMEEKGESLRCVPREAASADSPEIVAVKAFIAAVNTQDFAALSALMTDDHTFVDSGGAAISGREAMLAGWRQYFALFPDYRIAVGSVLQSGAVVAVFGSWSGTYVGKRGAMPENAVDGPAAWKVLVEGDRIKTWQVFADHTKTSDVVKRSQE